MEKQQNPTDASQKSNTETTGVNELSSSANTNGSNSTTTKRPSTEAESIKNEESSSKRQKNEMKLEDYEVEGADCVAQSGADKGAGVAELYHRPCSAFDLCDLPVTIQRKVLKKMDFFAFQTVKIASRKMKAVCEELVTDGHFPPLCFVGYMFVQQKEGIIKCRWNTGDYLSGHRSSDWGYDMEQLPCDVRCKLVVADFEAGKELVDGAPMVWSDQYCDLLKDRKVGIDQLRFVGIVSCSVERLNHFLEVNEVRCLEVQLKGELINLDSFLAQPATRKLREVIVDWDATLAERLNCQLTMSNVLALRDAHTIKLPWIDVATLRTILQECEEEAWFGDYEFYAMSDLVCPNVDEFRPRYLKEVLAGFDFVFGDVDEDGCNTASAVLVWLNRCRQPDGMSVYVYARWAADGYVSVNMESYYPHL